VRSAIGSIRPLLQIIVAIGCLLAASMAYADGKVFSRVVADVKMPDQSATLAWCNGEVYLAIEPSFKGEGTEFAWIVPVPGEVEVEPVTSGTFAMLRRQTTATVGQFAGTPETSPLLWCFLLLLLLFIVIGFKLDRRTRHSPKVKLRDWIIVGFVLAVLVPLSIVPAVSSARGGGSAQSGVSVIRHAAVGSYDTAILMAQDANALTAWLNGNGFHVADDAAVRQAAQNYIDDGWRFVAIKLRGDDLQGSKHSAHPLGFRFRAATPIYPLRLTGAGFPSSDRLDVELFVFADQQAAIDGWSVAYCGTSSSDDREHPGLRQVRQGMKVCTRLRASLSAKQMRQDAAIRWKAPEQFREHLRTPLAALMVGMNVGMAAFLPLVLFVMWRDVKQGAPDSMRKHAMVAVICAGIVIAVTFAQPRTSSTTQITSGFLSSSPEYREFMAHFHVIHHELKLRYVAAKDAHQTVTLATLRQWHAELAPADRPPGDGPGQCEVSLMPDGILTLMRYDQRGGSDYGDFGPELVAGAVERID